VRSLAEKRAEEARQLMLSGKRDRKPSAKVRSSIPAARAKCMQECMQRCMQPGAEAVIGCCSPHATPVCFTFRSFQRVLWCVSSKVLAH
jgi:hypothetical protein